MISQKILSELERLTKLISNFIQYGEKRKNSILMSKTYQTNMVNIKELRKC